MTFQVTENIIVKGNINEVYEFWIDFENYSEFMQHVVSVREAEEGLTHWVMEGPEDTRIEWDAEITRMEVNRRVAWNSKDDQEMATSGQVTLTGLPKNETQISMTLQYAPPKSLPKKVVDELFGDFSSIVTEDLRRFKAQFEAATEPATAAG